MGNYSGLWNGLVAHFPGVLNSSNYLLETQLGLNGAPTGTTTTGTDRFGMGKCRTFSGSQYFVVSDSGTALRTAFTTDPIALTIVIVAKFPSLTSGIVLSNLASGETNSGFYVGINTTYAHIIPGLRTTWDGGCGAYSPNPLSTGWHVCCFVLNGSNMPIVYADGISGSNSGSTSRTHIGASPRLLCIGAHPDGGYNYKISQDLGEIMIFNTVKTSVEVSTISKLLLTKPIQNPHNLRSWWA